MLKLKLVAGLVAGATLLTAGTVSAFASSQGNGFGICQKDRACDGSSCSSQCYVDTDNDGVCDNRGVRCDGGYYVDVSSASAGDSQGATCNGCGRNYVDADGDGVCDNCTSHCGGSMARNCHGHGNGHQGHHG